MSETYKDLTHTSLPESMTKLIKFRDPYASEVTLASQYDSYMAAGNLDAAQTLLADNPNLKECILNADIILTLLHDDIALQRIFFSDIETYVMSVIQYDKNYTEGKACERYAVVPYNNQVYFCYEACPEGTLPTDTDYFYPITLKGDKGNPGVNFVPMGKWVSGTTYSTNQAVTHNNILWYSTVDNNTEEPSDTSTGWEKALMLSQDASTISLTDGSTVEDAIKSLNEDVSRINTNLTNNYATQTYVGNSINNFKNNTLAYLTILTGSGAPLSSTEGKVRQYYRDTDSGRLYECEGSDEDGNYVWTLLIRETDTMTPTKVFEFATSANTEGYPSIDTIDHRYFVIDVGDNNILKYYDVSNSAWKPITSVWS